MATSTIHRLPVACALLAALLLAPAGRPGTATAQDGDYPIFLPLVYGALAGENAIPNGDFEAGRTEWSESSTWDNVLIVAAGDLPRGISPHGGSWAAWLGGDNNETATLAQTVVVDPDFPYLAFWYWLDWPFSCVETSAALVTVTLGETVVYEREVCESTDTGGWARQVVDARAFAGEAVSLRFQLRTPTNSFANFYLDDVVFRRTP